ncbi:glycosyltransferase [Pseudooceanicola batsensis HTCC2597]|uniref:Glycosyltransferase n=1 Tax=Pseudooceanicola batsensis (strain ATCC BAA-863 / DSM 15984 / KCTC 12145 / HTCC2597) TaxID=252305 RepID=A3TWD7_PSEBH|nr:glycosyltransferase family 1 protein [Pseudooceanicola batsensis]EAQ03933.1 glycosyltransferase [Pseudooceanicola batsensis HTCC2597]
MPGGGIRLATTTNNPEDRVRLLDLTRLASRPGRQPTGIDRVELAYLRELLDREGEVWGLARVATGYVILGRSGLTSFMHRLQGRTPWGKTRFIFHFAGRLSPLQKRVQSDLWRLAHTRAWGKRLAPALAALPNNLTYLNVGHSNLTGNTLTAISAHPGAKITVMVHDTIPLDHPEFCRDESTDRARGMIRRVMHHADLVLCNSEKTRGDVIRHMAALNEDADPEERTAPPNCLVARLGIDPPRPDAAAIPPELPRERPLFLTVGTIEPRKNHLLLLDIWENWKQDEDGPRPVLGICGARGWLNEEVFRRLDRSPLRGSDIFEWPNLPDRAISALLQHAHALLFPSLAEGYGLPPIEAAALRTPVISADLASIRETLGDLPVYLDSADSYSWKKAIKSRIEVGRSGTEGIAGFMPPTWDEHFKVVLKMA